MSRRSFASLALLVAGLSLMSLLAGVPAVPGAHSAPVIPAALPSTPGHQGPGALSQGGDAARALPLPDPQVYAALGDSITPAYDANGQATSLGVQPWYSYAVANNTASTGVYSFYQRLLTIYPNSTGVDCALPQVQTGCLYDRLLAVPGDKASDMVWQSLDAVRDGAGFVSILIGGNDVCSHSGSTPTPTPVWNFSASLNRTFEILRTELPPTTVIALANVVNVSILWTLFGGNSQAELVWQSTCPALLNAPSRAMMQYMVRAYNHVEQRIARSWNVSLWDIGNLTFSAQDVNHLDYFHPSPTGHTEIADEWWAALPYATMFPRFTSAPALPSSVPVGTSLGVQVGVQDVVAPTVTVTYKDTGAFFWSTVELSLLSGKPFNGTYGATLPFNATSVVGTLQLYLSASDVSGYLASLPGSPLQSPFQVAISSPGGGGSSPLKSVQLSPSSSTLHAGGSVTLLATALDANGSTPSTGVAYNWTLSSPAVGQLIPENDGSQALFVAGEAAGNATISVSATSGVASAVSNPAQVQVLPTPPASSQPPPATGSSPNGAQGTMPILGDLVVAGPLVFLALMGVAGLLLRHRYLHGGAAASKPADPSSISQPASTGSSSPPPGLPGAKRP